MSGWLGWWMVGGAHDMASDMATDMASGMASDVRGGRSGGGMPGMAGLVPSGLVAVARLVGLPAGAWAEAAIRAIASFGWPGSRCSIRSISVGCVVNSWAAAMRRRKG